MVPPELHALMERIGGTTSPPAIRPRPNFPLVAPEDAEERAARRTDLIGWMPVPFQRLRFASPELVELVPGGAAKIASVAEAFEHARQRTRRARLGGVVLVGKAGAAKTALACAWLGGQIDADRPRARFVPAMKLAELRHMGDGRPVPWLDLATSAAPLVLDDLGAELTGAPEAGGLAAQRVKAASDLIHARYDLKRPIVVTTCHDEAALARIYGDGVARRVYDGAAVISLRRAAP